MKSKWAVLVKVLAREGRIEEPWKLVRLTDDRHEAAKYYEQLADADDDTDSCLIILFSDGSSIPVSAQRRTSSLSLVMIYKDAAQSVACITASDKIRQETPF